MSTPTETKTDFVDENAETVESTETVENVHQGENPTPVAPEQPEHQHDHAHHHHTHENGELSPLCSGGGCADGSPRK